jgi:cellulose synthase/poly-beta-1,6-N-acetylglucosamine synthase-like glycosyltransferase
VHAADISVLIPTYGRPRDLQRCLTALTRQTTAPADVVVVARAADDASRSVARSFEARLPLRVAFVQRPGQVQALNCGLAVVATSLVAITDDDACPRPDWLQRIVGHFADPAVGAVGGRDVVHRSGDVVVEGRARAVGRVTWFGRVIGNHHLDGSLQDVQFLKGANMSYRRETLAGFDENLAGDGAQNCNDMQASLRVHTSGWRVVWDPRVAIDHYPAARLDDDDRVTPTLRAVTNTLHNQTYTVLSLLSGWRRATAFAYSLLVGTRLAPGLAMVPVALLTGRSARQSAFGFRANLEGRARGLRTYLRTGGKPRF